MSDLIRPFYLLGCDSRCITCRIIKECTEMYHQEEGNVDFFSEEAEDKYFELCKEESIKRYEIFKPFIPLSNCGMVVRDIET
jgi:hypothetical protein